VRREGTRLVPRRTLHDTSGSYRPQLNPLKGCVVTPSPNSKIAIILLLTSFNVTLGGLAPLSAFQTPVFPSLQIRNRAFPHSNLGGEIAACCLTVWRVPSFVLGARAVPVPYHKTALVQPHFQFRSYWSCTKKRCPGHCRLL